MHKSKRKHEEEEEECKQRKKEKKGSHFFAFILPSCIQDGRLAIPKKFLRKCGKELSGTVVLKVPSTKEWCVELKEEGGQVWFQTGWDAFVDYHSISAWYFLSFKYDGHSLFNVVIFDKTGSEIEYPCDIDNLEEHDYEIGSETSLEQKNEDQDPMEVVLDIQSEDPDTRKYLTTASPPPGFSFRPNITKRAETTFDSGLGCHKQRKRSLSPSKSPAGPVRNNLNQDNDTGKRRKLFVGNENNGMEQEGIEVQFVTDEYAKDSLSKPDFNDNDEQTILSQPKFISNWVDNKDVHLRNNEQEFDPCAHYMGRPTEYVDDTESESNKQEECDVFGYIFKGIAERGALESNCPNNNELTMSARPNLTSISPSSDHTYRMKKMEAPQESLSSSLCKGVQSSVGITTNDETAVVDSHLNKVETKTGGSSILCLEQNDGIVTVTSQPVPFCEKERVQSSGANTTKNETVEVDSHLNKLETRTGGSLMLCLKQQDEIVTVTSGPVPFCENQRVQSSGGNTTKDDTVEVDSHLNKLVSRTGGSSKLCLKQQDEIVTVTSEPVPYCEKERVQSGGGNTTEDETVGVDSHLNKLETRTGGSSMLCLKQQDEIVTVTSEPMPLCQKEIVMEDGAFESENPFCTITQRPSYVHEPFILSKRSSAQSNSQSCNSGCPVRNKELQNEDTGMKRSLFDPKEKIGLEQIGNEVDLPKSDCEIFRSHCLVRKGEENKDTGKERRLFNSMEKNGVEQIGNGEIHFVADKKINLPSFGCLSISDPIISTSPEFTSDWIDNENWNMTSISGNDQEGGALGFCCPDNHDQTMSLIRPHPFEKSEISLESSSSFLYSGVLSEENDIIISETAEDESHCINQEPSGKESSIVVKLQNDASSAFRRTVPTREMERSIIAARFSTYNNPVCVDTMRPSYVLGKFKLNIPSSFAYKYLKDAFGFELQLSNGGISHAGCNVGDLHKVAKGWKDFALDNHLKEDDVCIFELSDRNHNELKVSIHRFLEHSLQLDE